MLLCLCVCVYCLHYKDIHFMVKKYQKKSPQNIQYVILHMSITISRASLVAQLVKNLPAMQEPLVQFVGQEDPLEKG